MSKPTPEIISLTHDQVETIKARIAGNAFVDDSDKKIILSVLSVYFWLQVQLQQAKLSISRLKNIFSLKTEKKTLK